MSQPIPTSLPSTSWKTYFQTLSCFWTPTGSNPRSAIRATFKTGIVDSDHADPASGSVDVLDDVHVAVLGQLPDRLDVVGKNDGSAPSNCLYHRGSPAAESWQESRPRWRRTHSTFAANHRDLHRPA